MNEDHYGNLGYRHLFAWSDRLEREWPFLTRELAHAPECSVIDLGCGPGEHLGRLAAEGWEGLGIDTSAAQIESARTHHPRAHFAQGSMEQIASLTERRFGAALCLGNVLPNLDDPALDRTLEQLVTRLLPNAVFVIQLLEYEKIRRGDRRAIGPVLRPPREGAPAGDETVFLRLFAPGPDPEHVRFTAITLCLHATAEPAVEIERAERVLHRAWTETELRELLLGWGFERIRSFGDLRGQAFTAGTSDDLVLVARYAGSTGES